MKRAGKSLHHLIEPSLSEFNLMPLKMNYFNQVKTIKTILFSIAVLLAVSSAAQLSSDVFQSLPKNLELSDEIQKFKVTTTHFNGDIFGNFLNKQQICGECTRNPLSNEVKWNNVSIAFSNVPNRNAEFPQSISIDYMENFTYSVNDNMLSADKFESFTEYSDFTKNLVWDMLAIEGFAYNSFDKLQLNKPYSEQTFNGKMDLAGQGFFENKDIQLLWTGISKRNDELCATINYRTLNNPLEVKTGGMDMKGRSHYWGTIWVSLEDKQIEHAVLYEDVVLEMLLPGQTQKTILNATREISFERMM